MISPVGRVLGFFCSQLWPNLSDKVRASVKIHCILESNLGPFAGF